MFLYCCLKALRLQASRPEQPLLYVELDLPRVSKRKVQAVSRHARLQELIPGSFRTVVEPGARLRSSATA